MGDFLNGPVFHRLNNNMDMIGHHNPFIEDISFLVEKAECIGYDLTIFRVCQIIDTMTRIKYLLDFFTKEPSVFNLFKTPEFPRSFFMQSLTLEVYLFNNLFW